MHTCSQTTSDVSAKMFVSLHEGQNNIIVSVCVSMFLSVSVCAHAPLSQRWEVQIKLNSLQLSYGHFPVDYTKRSEGVIDTVPSKLTGLSAWASVCLCASLCVFRCPKWPELPKEVYSQQMTLSRLSHSDQCSSFEEVVPTGPLKCDCACVQYVCVTKCAVSPLVAGETDRQ